jgi:hypothetical protein
MWRFLLGGAIGYVLGSRAGRGPYERLRRRYDRVVDHPATQAAAGVASATIVGWCGRHTP